MKTRKITMPVIYIDRIFFILMMLLLSSQLSHAQTDISYTSSRLQLAYKNQAYLSFNVKYTYAYDSIPSTIIDSSNGTFKISGTSYWGTLDSIEYMQNNSYAIVLYKSEKVMGVSNSSPVYPAQADFSVFDSLKGSTGLTTSLATSGIHKTITLTFSGTSSPYKNFKVTYDSVTNWVSQVAYTLREDYAGDRNSFSYSASGNTSPYIIVKADYSNYQTSTFSTAIFNTGNYFVLTGNTYVPQSPYSDYEVFIGSPNLIK